MSLLIPKSFSTKTGSVQLSDLDTNFTYLTSTVNTALDITGTAVTGYGNTTVYGTLGASGIVTLANNLTVGGTIGATGNLTVNASVLANTYKDLTSVVGTSFNTTTGRVNLTYGNFIFQNDSGLLTPTNKTKVQWFNEAANTWTVPAGVTFIFVKMWGGGGGGAAYGGWNQGSLGGAGGFTQALVPVVPGETITIRCGGRGLTRNGAYKAYPDGGGSATGAADARYSASGGGSSSINVPSIPAAWCMYAGGGGGGGSVNGYAVNSGGAGGGLNGQAGVQNNYNVDGTGQNYGKGGSQTAGGAAGVGASANNGQAGSLGQGGTFQRAEPYGAGGGGGYYGGGSGAYGVNLSMGGGGGGSGYIHPSLILAQTYTGSSRVPPFAHDPDLAVDNAVQYATGGHEDGYGGPGVVIIYY